MGLTRPSMPLITRRSSPIWDCAALIPPSSSRRSWGRSTAWRGEEEVGNPTAAPGVSQRPSASNRALGAPMCRAAPCKPFTSEPPESSLSSPSLPSFSTAGAAELLAVPGGRPRCWGCSPGVAARPTAGRCCRPMCCSMAYSRLCSAVKLTAPTSGVPMAASSSSDRLREAIAVRNGGRPAGGGGGFRVRARSAERLNRARSRRWVRAAPPRRGCRLEGSPPYRSPQRLSLFPVSPAPPSSVLCPPTPLFPPPFPPRPAPPAPHAPALAPPLALSPPLPSSHWPPPPAPGSSLAAAAAHVPVFTGDGVGASSVATRRGDPEPRAVTAIRAESEQRSSPPQCNGERGSTQPAATAPAQGRIRLCRRSASVLRSGWEAADAVLLPRAAQLTARQGSEQQQRNGERPPSCFLPDLEPQHTAEPSAAAPCRAAQAAVAPRRLTATP